jgi:ornithine carbamoyltransferase
LISIYTSFYYGLFNPFGGGIGNRQSTSAEALKIAKKSGAKLTFGNEPKEAVKACDVVTTDTWISMGQESEKETKIKAFDGYMVDKKMMSLAKDDAIFLHCLPAYRGYEVSEELFEEHAEVIFSEAENRLHAQKGIMVWLDQHRNDTSKGE